ncbi:MAG: TIGR00296 family protein [Candidatus Parvarchaeota archaeon]|nr:TIGR00296 family protein [Candidatus Jingweiarchaeum tengchongense]MCW1297864.1 TIGR00296 family protein [Candidatus Jingweiarchaeum tengchongense]MCW1299875.1 TIGR00296 family protein [Candidatus Jingweiarchaeum tengchongense]MCW1304155.1 TIGR00296 family protein [Candidatus Jingweiarchaeum tengchongense]MCW1305183.1 TIGR00296 family protein [Candidatus Jingweiarchaeum tengchongense]
MTTLNEAKRLIKIARESIALAFKGEKYELKEKIFEEKRGIFVTLLTYPERELRGCIGIPEPILPLKKAVVEAAISSAFNDPRFPSLREDELNKIVIEISLLTKPSLISVKNPKEYPNKIEVGKDGLIVQKGFFSGLLLPQVAKEYGWDAEEFLSQTCIKAGLTPDSWLDMQTKIYKFQAEIFCEKEPNGEVESKN